MADSALYSEANLQKLAQTHIKWITRVPATVPAAQSVLAQADPQALASLTAGYRYRELTATYGGIEPRWVRIDAEARRAPRTAPATSSGASSVTQNSKP